MNNHQTSKFDTLLLAIFQSVVGIPAKYCENLLGNPDRSWIVTDLNGTKYQTKGDPETYLLRKGISFTTIEGKGVYLNGFASIESS